MKYFGFLRGIQDLDHLNTVSLNFWGQLAVKYNIRAVTVYFSFTPVKP